MIIVKSAIRCLGMAATVVALAAISGQSSRLRAETGATCDASDPSHACVKTTFDQGDQCSSHSGCTTCEPLTGYNCDPYGSGVFKEDWKMDWD